MKKPNNGLTKETREKLHQFLKTSSENGFLSWHRQAEAAGRFGIKDKVVEEIALSIGIMPARYRRNREMISVEDQLKLFRSRVAVIGCGGLGGYVIEALARLGIGNLTVIDPDVFEEHNLNRQLMASIDSLSRSKAAIAAIRVGRINPTVTVTSHQKAFSRENGPVLLKGMDMAVDALDSIPVRMELSEVCLDLKIPLVHGSIAGWYGQVAVQAPGSDLIKKIFGNTPPPTGIEKELGNPSFTPATIASLQAAEVCKCLLNKGKTLENRMMSINLLDMETVNLEF